MYFLGKILGVGLACSLPITVAVSSFYWKGKSKTAVPKILKLEQDKDFEANCYVLGTKNNQVQKLLVCEDSSDFSTIYYLFKREEDNRSYVKVISLVKQLNTDLLLMKLENKEGLDDKEITLEVSDKEWKDFKRNMELTPGKDCHIKWENANLVTEKTVLLCSTWNPNLVNKEILLSPFKVTN